MKKIVSVIPARYQSSRFPGKPLVLLLNKPMIIWVAEISARVIGRDNTYIATDDLRIADTVKKHGYNCLLTSSSNLTGTDRLAEAAGKIQADIYINIQGDEPTLDPISVRRVIEEKIKHRDFVINAMTKLTADEDPENINLPKVVFNQDKKMIYMSRLPIPGFKDFSKKPAQYFKQVCIYAFNKKELIAFGSMEGKGRLEGFEDIEILRFLDLNIPVKMIEVKANSYAVDIPEDVPKVEKRLKEIYNL